MKKIIVSLFFVAATLLAHDSDRVIQVSGKGSVVVPASYSEWTLSLVVPKGKEGAASSNEVFRTLKAKKKEMEAFSYVSRITYDPLTLRTNSQSSGWSGKRSNVSESIRVKATVTDLAKELEFLEYVFRSGLFSVEKIAYYPTEQQAHEDASIKIAIAESKRKADLVAAEYEAEVSGLKSVHFVNVEKKSASYGGVDPFSDIFMPQEEGEPQAFSSENKTVRFSSSVSATFQLTVPSE